MDMGSVIPNGFLKTLGEAWVEKLKFAYADRHSWEVAARTCWMFTFEDTHAMWGQEFLNRLGSGIEAPNFKVSINKGAEYLSIFGPYLFWQYPYRTVQPIEAMDLTPAMFGMPTDPFVIALFEQYKMSQEYELQFDKGRCSMMERYLNYSQREQPFGGLEAAVNLAITDALITGRGILMPRTYGPPGSDRTLTGCFHKSVFDLFIDPDCIDPSLETAKWVAIRHVTPQYELERMFDLEPDSLKKSANVSSIDAKCLETMKGRLSHDVVVWYEIWTKCGLGFHLKNGKRLDLSEQAQQLEGIAGDFAYLCVTENCPYPLNIPPFDAPIEEMAEEIRQSTQWPHECWRDNRWPFAILDFYPEPGTCWPMPPLASGMGELLSMNILQCAFLDMAYENRKQIVAYFKDAVKNLDKSLKSKSSICYIPLDTGNYKDIREAISILERPQVNMDLMNAYDRLSAAFDKRTGLVEFMYAQSTSQSRSAMDVQAKEEKSSIRPEDMSRKVTKFMSELATLEASLAATYVKGAHIAPLLGETVAGLWDRFIGQADPETQYREFRTVIQASDVRKPNKAQQAQNMQTLTQTVLPLLGQQAFMTGNFAGVREFILDLGRSMEQDTSGWLPQDVPPPQPEPTEDTTVQDTLAINEDEREDQRLNLETQESVERVRASREKTKADMLKALAAKKSASRPAARSKA